MAILEEKLLFDESKAIFLSSSTIWADSIISTLSEEERIAQLFMVAAYSNTSEDHKKYIANLVEKYKINNIIFVCFATTPKVRNAFKFKIFKFSYTIFFKPFR